ncbi:MAG: peptidase U32 family protein [Planctomycetota bacterium]
MKLLAPIRSIEELDMLVGCGAEELYCGVFPEEWLKRFGGAVWVNRRPPRSGNLGSLTELRELARQASRLGIPLHVTLNSPHYGLAVEKAVLELATECREAGVSALILADPGIIARLLEQDPSWAIHVSSVAAVLNSMSARFFRSLGVRRIILPRSLTLPEIDRIAGAVPEVELEAFLLNDSCAFEEGFCHTTHHPAVGAYCTALAGLQHFVESAGGELDETRRRHIADTLLAYHRWISERNLCGPTQGNGQPVPVPCALCAIPTLARSGIAAVKIVGREIGLGRKAVSVSLVRAILDRHRAGATPEELSSLARKMRGDPTGCASGIHCYYPLGEE